jgi:hypothetical protein
MNVSAKIPAWKEPGFWLVMAPLILVVVVSMGTVSLAFRVADDRVQDDYFKEGRMINKRFAEEQNALALSVSGRLEFDFPARQVLAELTASALPGELRLTFSHPVDAGRDSTVILKRTGEREFRADLPQVLNGRWYLVVSAAESTAHKGWRVSTEVDFQKNHTALFAAHM